MSTESVNGAELYYESSGDGVPVVFLHGVLMSSRFFNEQQPLAEGCQIITLDFRGHGRSEKTETGHTLPQYARDLEAFLDAQGLSDVVLVGWSMGSLVAWEYVSQFGTDRFRGFVSVEQQPLDLEQEGYDHGVFDFDELRGLMELAQTSPHELAWSLIEQMLVDESAAVEQRFFDEITRVPPSITSAILFDQSVRDYRRIVPEVDVPTLVCLGEDETMLENAGVEYVGEKTPDAEVERFSNSGHCPFLEEPEAFNEVVSSFITNRCHP
ncbi:alpha/beta fold hydrolase [Halorubrum rutilum]|uniref:Alpha/beta fold hydrolase n=1 Tax=Halorubrum rutilum TaxID=1364933 RepID=A0ABD6AP55_9EURY|nr:alpha/beta hydrolase [Halorubrum rutilum]